MGSLGTMQLPLSIIDVGLSELGVYDCCGHWWGHWGQCIDVGLSWVVRVGCL